MFRFPKPPKETVVGFGPMLKFSPIIDMVSVPKSTETDKMLTYGFCASALDVIKVIKTNNTKTALMDLIIPLLIKHLRH